MPEILGFRVQVQLEVQHDGGFPGAGGALVLWVLLQ